MTNVCFIYDGYKLDGSERAWVKMNSAGTANKKKKQQQQQLLTSYTSSTTTTTTSSSSTTTSSTSPSSPDSVRTLHDFQLSKCLNEKRRREQENLYIEELADILQTSFVTPDMTTLSVKPDKCAILHQTVRKIKQLRSTENNSCSAITTSAAVQQEEVSSSAPTSLLNNTLIGPLVLEALEGFLFLVNSEGKIEYISDNVESFIKFTQDELLGQVIYNFIHVGDHHRFTSSYLSVWNSDNGKELSRTNPVAKQFVCRFLVKPPEDKEQTVEEKQQRNSEYEYMQMIPVVLKNDKDNKEQHGLDQDGHPYTFCIARRLTSATEPFSAAVEQFTTRLDGNFRVLSVDVTGLPSKYSQHLSTNQVYHRNFIDLVHSADLHIIKSHFKETSKNRSSVSPIYRLKLNPSAGEYIKVLTKSRMFVPDPKKPQFSCIMATHSITGSYQEESVSGPDHSSLMSGGNNNPSSRTSPNSLLDTVLGPRSTINNNNSNNNLNNTLEDKNSATNTQLRNLLDQHPLLEDSVKDELPDILGGGNPPMKKESSPPFFDTDSFSSGDLKPSSDSLLKTEFGLKNDFSKDMKREFRSPQSINSPIASSSPSNSSMCNNRGPSGPNRSPSRDPQRGIKRPNEDPHDGNPSKQPVGVFENMINTSPQSAGAASMSPASHSHPNTPHGRPITPHGGPNTPLGRPNTPHGGPTTPHGGPTTPHGPPTPHGGPTTPHGPLTPHGGRPPTPQHSSAGTNSTMSSSQPMLMAGSSTPSNQAQGCHQQQQHSDNKMLRSLLSTDGPQVPLKMLNQMPKPNSLPQEKLPHTQDLMERLRRPGPWQTDTTSSELILKGLLSEPLQKGKPNANNNNVVTQQKKLQQQQQQQPMVQMNMMNSQQQQQSILQQQQQMNSRGGNSPSMMDGSVHGNSVRVVSSASNNINSMISSSNFTSSAAPVSSTSFPNSSLSNNNMQQQQQQRFSDSTSSTFSSQHDQQQQRYGVSMGGPASGSQLNKNSSSVSSALLSNSSSQDMITSSMMNTSNSSITTTNTINNMMGNNNSNMSGNNTTTLPRFSVSMGGINPLGNLPADGTTLPSISRVENVILQQQKQQQSLHQNSSNQSIDQQSNSSCHMDMLGDQHHENPTSSTTSDNDVDLVIQTLIELERSNKPDTTNDESSYSDLERQKKDEKIQMITNNLLGLPNAVVQQHSPQQHQMLQQQQSYPTAYSPSDGSARFSQATAAAAGGGNIMRQQNSSPMYSISQNSRVGIERSMSNPSPQHQQLLLQQQQRHKQLRSQQLMQQQQQAAGGGGDGNSMHMYGTSNFSDMLNSGVPPNVSLQRNNGADPSQTYTMHAPNTSNNSTAAGQMSPVHHMGHQSPMVGATGGYPQHVGSQMGYSSQQQSQQQGGGGGGVGSTQRGGGASPVGTSSSYSLHSPTNAGPTVMTGPAQQQWTGRAGAATMGQQQMTQQMSMSAARYRSTLHQQQSMRGGLPNPGGANMRSSLSPNSMVPNSLSPMGSTSMAPMMRGAGGGGYPSGAAGVMPGGRSGTASDGFSPSGQAGAAGGSANLMYNNPQYRRAMSQPNTNMPGGGVHAVRAAQHFSGMPGGGHPGASPHGGAAGHPHHQMQHMNHHHHHLQGLVPPPSMMGGGGPPGSPMGQIRGAMDAGNAAQMMQHMAAAAQPRTGGGGGSGGGGMVGGPMSNSSMVVGSGASSPYMAEQVPPPYDLQNNNSSMYNNTGNLMDPGRGNAHGGVSEHIRSELRACVEARNNNNNAAAAVGGGGLPPQQQQPGGGSGVLPQATTTTTINNSGTNNAPPSNNMSPSSTLLPSSSSVTSSSSSTAGGGGAQYSTTTTATSSSHYSDSSSNKWSSDARILPTSSSPMMDGGGMNSSVSSGDGATTSTQGGGSISSGGGGPSNTCPPPPSSEQQQQQQKKPSSGGSGNSKSLLAHLLSK